MITVNTSGKLVAELEALRQLAKLRRQRSFEQFRKRLRTEWSPLAALDEIPEKSEAFPRAIAAE